MSRSASRRKNTKESKAAHDPPKAPPRQRIWSYGVNVPFEEVPEQALKGFKHTGNFRTDFTALCELAHVVPNTSLAVLKDTDIPEEPNLVIQSILFDLASMRITRHVLPTATQLQLVRFSACCLDIDMLALLKAGLGDSGCTVTTLHIDWNPLELPVDVEALRAASHEGRLDALDDLERRRRRLQGERAMRNFSEKLRAACGNLDELLQEVAEIADPDYRATATLTPLNSRSWMQAFQMNLELPPDEIDRVFRIMDGPDFGRGDGLISIQRFKEVLQGIPIPSAEEEVKDPIGAAFASFLDGTSLQEMVSFRCCNIGRIETQALARAVSSCNHLRALNLWGNQICDHGAAALAGALECYFGLQYLGLGRNRVTHVGLVSLCKVLGTTRLDTKEQADHPHRHIKDQMRERDRKMRSPLVPKKDANGRDRYVPPEAFHVDSCEERKDPSTGQVCWVWTRNTVLKTLGLENNPISDAEAVLQLQPLGCGDLVLRNTPCAEALLRRGQAEQSAEGGQTVESEDGSTPVQATSAPPAFSPLGGWRLVLH